MNKFLFHNELKYRIARHITFFIVIVLVFTFVLFSRNEGHLFFELLLLTTLNALFFLGYGYLTIFILLPVFLPSKKYFLLGISFITTGLLLSVLKLSISDFIFYSSISPEYADSQGIAFFRQVLINTKDMSFIVALFVIAKFTKDWMIVENKRKTLERKHEELQLRLLQGHFEPHFLFNTLNNLYALSLSNHERTTEFIKSFRSVLRFSISEVKKERVPITEELEMIEDFIRLEQIRYGDRLRVERSLTGDCSGISIAPFILFALVENCFRHGSSADAGHPWISLSLNCSDGRIFFETKNSVPSPKKQSINTNEKGFPKLKRRLNIQYPGKHNLQLTQSENEYTARLELDLN